MKVKSRVVPISQEIHRLMFCPARVRKSSCAYLVQQNLTSLPHFFRQQHTGSYVLPPQASDISAQGQLVKSEGRNWHPRHVCCWGVNIQQQWHPCSCFCLSPALSCVTDRTWRACSQSCSTGLESHERHSFLCISNWLTCNHYGSNAIFLPQDLGFSGMLFQKTPSENSW